MKNLGGQADHRGQGKVWAGEVHRGMDQAVCPAKLLEKTRFAAHAAGPGTGQLGGCRRCPRRLPSRGGRVGWFQIRGRAGRAPVDGEPWGHAGAMVWVRLRNLSRSTHRAGSGFWRIWVQRGWADAGVGAFLVGGVRLGFFRRDPGCETVVTGLAADRLFEDESVQEVPRFGGRRVDPVGFAPGADQNSPREKRHYPPLP